MGARPRANPAAIMRALKRNDNEAIDALCDVAELGGGEPAEHVLTDAELAAMEAEVQARGGVDYDEVAQAALAPLPSLTDGQCHRVSDLLLAAEVTP